MDTARDGLVEVSNAVADTQADLDSGLDTRRLPTSRCRRDIGRAVADRFGRRQAGRRRRGRGLRTRATTATRRLWIWRRWACGVTLRSRSGAVGTGRTGKRPGTRCMGTGTGNAASEAGILQRRRGELVEWPFAHLYETGMRRVHLRGIRTSEAPAGTRRGLQPRAAPPPSDRRWHTPGPAGPGHNWRLGTDRATCGLLEQSGAALDTIPARFGADRRAIALPASSTNHLNTEDFFLGLLGGEKL